MLKISVALLALVLSTGVFAQTQASSASSRQASSVDMQKVMDATMNSMVPAMARMAEATIEAQLNVAEKPETALRIATFKKNLYDALVKRGFTTDQALQITIGTAIPAMAAGK
jgi:hypothetical protein